MVRFVGLLISQTHQHVIRALFFIAVFVPLLSVTLAFVVAQVQGNIRSEAVTQLEAMRSVIAKVGDVGIRLRREATSEPCSPEFNLELRRIAYEPDGLNEFLFISGQSVLCSVGTLRYTTQSHWAPPISTSLAAACRSCGWTGPSIVSALRACMGPWPRLVSSP
jgi:sensor c-di-GMP phosphodiesterase-like protein